MTMISRRAVSNAVFLLFLGGGAIISSTGVEGKQKRSPSTVVSTAASQNIISQKNVAVIGGGFSGLAAALELKTKYGYNVTIYERLPELGGRAQQFMAHYTTDSEKKAQQIQQDEDQKDEEIDQKKGDGDFIFDFGPSWYWFPELFDFLFERFSDGKLTTKDFYETKTLDPAYRVFSKVDKNDVSSNSKKTTEIIDIPGYADAFQNHLAEMGHHGEMGTKPQKNGKWDPYQLAGGQQSDDIQKTTSKKSSTENPILPSLPEKLALRLFHSEAEEKYVAGIYEWIWKPLLSVTEFVDPSWSTWNLISATLRLDMFSSLEKHINKFAKDQKVRDILKWPIIFIGASPASAPAMYSLMTYGGHMLGTHYPIGKTLGTSQVRNGFRAPVEAMEHILKKNGVRIVTSAEVERFEISSESGGVTGICHKKTSVGESGQDSEPGYLEKLTKYSKGTRVSLKTKDTTTKETNEIICDIGYDGVVSSADYAHVENWILKNTFQTNKNSGFNPSITERTAGNQELKKKRVQEGVYYQGEEQGEQGNGMEIDTIDKNYESDSYWNKDSGAVYSPSSLLFYLGFDKQVPNLLHHNFFFDSPLDEHLYRVFAEKDIDTAHTNFTFYVTASSKTDNDSAPKNGEALFVLIPVPYTMNKRMDAICGRTWMEKTEKRKNCEIFWETLLDQVLVRMENELDLPQSSLKNTLVFERHAGTQEFQQGFNAARGNAFGLANTLSGSLVFKPGYEGYEYYYESGAKNGANAPAIPTGISKSSILSAPKIKKLPNLVFAGHLSNPGPGVPPSLVSGIVAANLLAEKIDPSIPYLDITNPSNIDSDQKGRTYLQIFVGFCVKLGAIIWNDIISKWFLTVNAVCVYLCLGIFVVHYSFSQQHRSELLCVYLMWRHGTTYFASACLMDFTRFLDTSAMYSLFRVADDIVDTVDKDDGVAASKLECLDKFEKDFWYCFKVGRDIVERVDKEVEELIKVAKADKSYDRDFCFSSEKRWKQLLQPYMSEFYTRHPIFPAVIAACIRNNYASDLFENFFKSMRLDAFDTGLVCSDLSDLMDYMLGSAAVIGDCMLPMLVPALGRIPCVHLEADLKKKGPNFQYKGELVKSEDVDKYQERVREYNSKNGRSQGDALTDAKLVKDGLELREKLLPTARALGHALQLTNMLRDVGEDLNFRREYVPRDITYGLFGLDLEAREENLNVKCESWNSSKAALLQKVRTMDTFALDRDFLEKHIEELFDNYLSHGIDNGPRSSSKACGSTCGSTSEGIPEIDKKEKQGRTPVKNRTHSYTVPSEAPPALYLAGHDKWKIRLSKAVSQYLYTGILPKDEYKKPLLTINNPKTGNTLPTERGINLKNSPKKGTPQEADKISSITTGDWSPAPCNNQWELCMEFFFSMADDFYLQAAPGIQALPKDVRGIIALAGAAYQQIHCAVRSRNWNIFLSSRARVGSGKKLKIATRYVAKLDILYMTFINLISGVGFRIGGMLLFLMTALFLVQTSNFERFYLESSSYNTVQLFGSSSDDVLVISYMQFHLVWIFPAILLFIYISRCDWFAKSWIRPTAWFNNAWYVWTVVLCIVATLYTTPWDNYLIYRGVWGYESTNRILFSIGWVPIEEYMYFSLETIICALLYYLQVPSVDMLVLPPEEGKGDTNVKDSEDHQDGLLSRTSSLTEDSDMMIGKIQSPKKNRKGKKTSLPPEKTFVPHLKDEFLSDDSTSSMDNLDKKLTGLKPILSFTAEESRGYPRFRRIGYFLILANFIFGCKLVSDAGGVQFSSWNNPKFEETEQSSGLYLGLIQVWSMPVLWIQFFFGAEAIYANLMSVLKVWICTFLYLGITDCWAIRNGIWKINPEYVMPITVQPFGKNLPFEEFYFFMVSSLMCTMGLHCAMMVTSVYKVNQNFSEAKKLQRENCKRTLSEKQIIESHERSITFVEALFAVHVWKVPKRGDYDQISGGENNTIKNSIIINGTNFNNKTRNSNNIHKKIGIHNKASSSSVVSSNNKQILVLPPSSSSSSPSKAASNNFSSKMKNEVTKNQKVLQSVWIPATLLSNLVGFLCIIYNALIDPNGLMNISLSSQVGFVAMTVIMFGLPHGAIDPLVWGSISEDNNARCFGASPVFFLGYFFFMGLTGLVWHYHSVEALITFILTSVFHWGTGDHEWWSMGLSMLKSADFNNSIASTPGMRANSKERSLKKQAEHEEALERHEKKNVEGSSRRRKKKMKAFLSSIKSFFLSSLSVMVRGGMVLVCIVESPLDSLRAFVPITTSGSILAATTPISHEEELFNTMILFQKTYHIHFFMTFFFLFRYMLLGKRSKSTTNGENLDCLVNLRIVPLLGKLLPLVSVDTLFPKNLTYRINMQTLNITEIIILYSLFRYFPPIIAFAIYFNIYHSLRHLICVWLRININNNIKNAEEENTNGGKSFRSSDGGGTKIRTSVNNNKNLFSAAFVFTALTVVGCVVAYILDFVLSSSTVETDSSITGGMSLNTAFGNFGVAHAMRLLFIGLSYVTTPHMLLIAWMQVLDFKDRNKRMEQGGEKIDVEKKNQ